MATMLNLRDVCRHLPEQPLLFALAFVNGLVAYHEAAFKRLNGNNPATLCTNLMNFHLIRVCTVKTARDCGD